MSKCNLSDTQLEQIHQKLINNTANMQPKERVAYQLNVLAGFEKSVPGITEQYKEYLNKKTESLLPTDAELKELDGLLDKITKGDKPGLGNLNSTEKARVFVLAEKLVELLVLIQQLLVELSQSLRWLVRKSQN